MTLTADTTAATVDLAELATQARLLGNHRSSFWDAIERRRAFDALDPALTHRPPRPPHPDFNDPPPFQAARARPDR
jgi:hypothetical protein